MLFTKFYKVIEEYDTKKGRNYFTFPRATDTVASRGNMLLEEG